MTTYNVHIDREVRLVFEGIEADSHEAAAAIACDKHPAAADDIDDCDGETFAAQVDVAGDEDSSQSVTIDFEPERQRQAAPKLLAVLKDVLRDAEGYARTHGAGPSAARRIRERCDRAHAAIAEAEAAGIRADMAALSDYYNA